MEPELHPTVLAEVCGAFRLGTVKSVTYLQDGRVNDSFLIRTSDGAYVLRRSRAERTTDAVSFEHALMAYLSGRGFPAPPLRTTIGGGTFLTIHGHIYRVTAFVPGQRCRPDDVTHLRVCAQTLARYHRLVADYGLPPRPGFVPILDELLAGLSSLPSQGDCMPPLQPTRPRPCGATETRRFWAADPRPQGAAPLGATGPLDWLDALHSNLVATCAKLTEVEPPPAVVVHASCRRESFVLLNGQVAAMLDYDSTHVDARALDLAIAVLSFALVRPEKTMLDVDRAAAFVAAYRVVAPIGRRELSLISWYMRARILKRALARYRHYRSVPQPSRAAKLQRAANLLRWLDEHEQALGSATTRAAEGTCA
ncbi:MAG: phosphotransferase [Actinomycetota bacterium]|nr:phosphotransferase [Actinomycetota bacterium]